MILAFDTYYYQDNAKTVGLSFNQWTDDKAVDIYVEHKANIPVYESGSFYKRELPCILSLLNQIKLDGLRCIVVDGFVVLDDQGTPGLGGHLYESLQGKVAVIGVAKSNFATLNKLKVELLRGESSKPLYITSKGIDLQQASACIKQMHGDYRMPSLLKQLDQLSREGIDFT